VRLIGLGVENKKSAGTLANPLYQLAVVRALKQRVDTVKWIRAATAGGNIRGSAHL